MLIYVQKAIIRILNMITDDEISEAQAINNVIYNKMKTQLAKDFSGKTIVIADGKFLGAEDSLENAWALASNYDTALVTRIEKKYMHAKILGSSLGILLTDVHKIEHGCVRIRENPSLIQTKSGKYRINKTVTIRVGNCPKVQQILIY